MLFSKLFAARAANATGTFSFLSGAIVYSATGGTSAAVAYPAGILAGDRLLICGLIQSSSAFGASTGWTTLVGSGSYATILHKVATGTETGSQTVTWGASAGAVHVMLAVRHSSGVTPSVEGSGGMYGVNPSITVTPPSVSYTQAAHGIHYRDNNAINMTALNANLTLLQYRTAAYGTWIGWLDTSNLGLINSTLTSNSAANNVTAASYVFYV